MICRVSQSLELAFDSAHHGAVPGPLLRVGQVRLGVQVGGDEMAAWVLADAQRGVLDLVVVEVPVEAHHHRAHLRAAQALLGSGHLLKAVRHSSPLVCF